jgi:hypothetical protein
METAKAELEPTEGGIRQGYDPLKEATSGRALEIARGDGKMALEPLKGDSRGEPCNQ